MKFAFYLLVGAGVVQAQGPIETAWIRSAPTDRVELRRVMPEVHDVRIDGDFVEIRSAGLSMTNLGVFQNPLNGEGGVRELHFRLPREPRAAEHPEWVGPAEIGVFLNGVPLYNRFAGASYLGRNVWHFDTVAMSKMFGVLANVPKPTLLGFAMDGYPIYGGQRVSSGYKLRRMISRTTLPDGKVLTPSQYGPAIDAQAPLGTFAEDYEYRPSDGDLDETGGRVAVTEEYPQGTYAYYMTDTYPYFIGEKFHGVVQGASLCEVKKLEFCFAEPRLEMVHERPMHLMVVSEDLREFDHVHPEYKGGRRFTVDYQFPKPGRYKLFAQYTPVGDAERTESYEVVVGEAKARVAAKLPITAKLIKPERILTGIDVPFRVELSGDPIEPYLGAWGHFVLLDAKLENFIHAHPGESAVAIPDPNVPHVHGMTDAAVGPPPSSVEFSTNFAKAGTYKLWAQFQVAGQPIVIPFTLEVEASQLSVTTYDVIPKDAIAVVVDKRGFTPARIEVKSGATLAITRSAEPNCASQIVFPSLGLKRDLPVGETVLVELPKFAGELAFSCGMGMYRGMVVVR